MRSRMTVRPKPTGSTAINAGADRGVWIGLRPRPHAQGGRYPEGVVIAPDGNKAYVANWASGDISVLNGETGQELRRIKASSGARALAIVPAG